MEPVKNTQRKIQRIHQDESIIKSPKLLIICVRIYFNFSQILRSLEELTHVFKQSIAFQIYGLKFPYKKKDLGRYVIVS